MNKPKPLKCKSCFVSIIDEDKILCDACTVLHSELIMLHDPIITKPKPPKTRVMNEGHIPFRSLTVTDEYETTGRCQCDYCILLYNEKSSVERAILRTKRFLGLKP